MNIIITGVSSGLGRQLALELLTPSKHNIISLGIGRDVQLHHPKFEFFNCDLSMPTHINEALNEVNKQFKHIDALINCAGVNVLEWIEKLKCTDWDYVMDVNARAPFLLTRSLMVFKMLRKGSAVINIISDAAQIPMTCSLAYNASKAALAMMTRQMARELTRRNGIYVFGVAPGKIAGTRMTKYVDVRVPKLRGWTAKRAEEYHRASKLYPHDIPPALLAQFIAQLITQREHYPFLTGTIIGYGV